MTSQSQTIERPPNSNGGPEKIETVIIGAGQTGLSLGYHLAQQDRPFVILEAGERVGDVWRKRFDSLRLYSPARYDGLPGLAFPADQWHFPTKDEVGDYLEEYARRFELPVVTGTSVQSLSKDGDRYLIECDGRRLAARNVVVASGGFTTPITPDLAHELDPGITQLHSNDYRNPSQLQDGPVLVVGAAHSGSDIALEVSREHRTTLAGPVRGEVPFRIDGRPFRVIVRGLWFIANHVLTMRTPLGRKMRELVRGEGGPLLRVKRADLDEAGVERTEEKVTGVEDGKPVLADGRIVDVANVIWCTGFNKDISWIQIPVAGEDGWPEQERGVVPSSPGLYFLGLPVQFAFASMLVGGAGRDAKYVANHIGAAVRAAS
jgi:putative flavoprotein involved in K+ transport